jgi:hypothetical protein
MPAQALASGVVVRITDSTDSSLTAERVWIDKVSAIADVPKWVKNLLVFWGEGRSVSIQLEFALPTGESKFSLPATVLDSSADRIVSVLNADV